MSQPFTQVAKLLELQLQHQSFQWRTDFLSDGLVGSPCSPRDSQESSPTPQFKIIKSSALSFLYGPTLTSIHDYRKKPYLFNICKSINVIHHVSQLKKKLSSQQMQRKLLIKFNTHLWLKKTKNKKNSPESRHRSIILQHSKVHIQQSHGKHYSQQWKTESISSKVRNKTRVPTLTTIIQHSFGSSSYSNQRRK